jgi:D-glycero-alpha-D-manno-heptose 1-phosphate guanylyltransferase
MEAVVLAGGLGTRLRSVVPDLPKPMAPINGMPFLAILLDKLAQAGFRLAILAVGYRHEAIRNYFGETHGALSLRYSVESSPLGTGGAMRLALQQSSAPDVFVVNGDTYLAMDYQAMLAAHLAAGAALTVAVRDVPDAARYGALEIANGRIRGFIEKGRTGPGKINAGSYLMKRGLLARHGLAEAFSFETDLLMAHIRELEPLAFETRGDFIDIGIPEDYARAQELLVSLAGSKIPGHGPS